MRTVTIEKSGNNYTVNPNASPSSSVTMYCFEDEGSCNAYSLTENPQVGDTMYVWYKDAGESLANYTGEVSAIEDDDYTIQLEYESRIVRRYSSGDIIIGE